MSVKQFVILIACTNASVEDIMHEQQKHSVVALDILNYRNDMDYISFKNNRLDRHLQEIGLMFVFGRNDSVIVRNEEGIRNVNARIAG